MTHPKPRCLILACGNTLRGDDGVGPWLAQWVEDHFPAHPNLRILSRQQWTPELAEEIAHTHSVLFLDCSVDATPGSIQLVPVHPAAGPQTVATHHSGASELLAMARDLYNSLPRPALQLTIGAGSTELGESFSPAVQAALPQTCQLIEETILRLLSASE
jgi:hydrogenase maturation protease